MQAQTITPEPSLESALSNFAPPTPKPTPSKEFSPRVLINDKMERGIVTPSKADTGTTAQLPFETTAESPPPGAPEEGKRVPPDILHRIEYRHRLTDNLVFAQEAPDPLVGKTSHAKDSVLEVNTVIFTTATSDSTNTMNGNSVWTVDNPPPTWQNGATSLKINSPLIISALQSVVEYYPGQSFLGDSVSVPEPYAILVHHQKELEEYRNNLMEPGKDEKVNICQKQQDTYRHIGILLDFLRDRVGAEVEKERQRNEKGFATFEMLWWLLRPGMDVYETNLFERDILEPYVVQSVAGGMQGGCAYAYNVTLWNLDYDGDKIGRKERTTTVAPFDGEKSISSLLIFPCHMLEEDLTGDQKVPRRQRLEERGRMFYKLTEKHCMHYAGYTMTYPKIRFDGHVMVDTITYYINGDPDNPDGSTKPHICRTDELFEDTSIRDSGCQCPACNMLRKRKTTSRKSRFANYDYIYPESTKGDLTPHQYFLFPSEVWGFVMKIRKWHLLDISCFHHPTFDTTLIEKLVMPPERRDLIKALSKSYVREDSAGKQTESAPWTADFVRGKGEGQIFLLHGGPGVGKTCTAECVAEYTRRPLLALSCSDIGVDPTTVESKLITYFKLAKQWGAILLIDEADIYMEKRVPQDLQRNSLVAGFLRALEYYQGLLFLTTNRIGAFDDAFISRIHVSLFYPDFTDQDRQQVWKTFIDKLDRDRNGKIRVPIGTKEYLEGSEIRSVKWNGRQIRNAFQTAVALAEFDGEKDVEGNILLKDFHIQKIVKMSSDFTEYLDELHKGNLAKRAERGYLRLETYGAS